MKILIVSQYYLPEITPVAFRMESLIKELISRGHEVHVLTSNPREYSTVNSKKDLESKDYKIERIELKNKGKSTVKRVFGFFEFYRKALKKKKVFKGQGFDLVVSSTPYMLQARAGQKIAKHIKAKHILDVRDLWPDSAIALKRIKNRGPISFLLRKLEKKLYKNADYITVTSPGYVEHIQKVIKHKKDIEIVFNGIDKVFEKEKKKEVSKDKDIKILYAGNIGVAQNLLTFVKSATNLDEKYSIELIGPGTRRKEIEDYIQDNNISNIKLSEAVDRETLYLKYLEADILYLQLYKDQYFNTVVPSKIFEYLEMNKPIVYDLGREANEILSKYEGTYKVDVKDAISFKKTIESIDLNSSYNRDTEKYLRSHQSKIFANTIEKIIE